jgi:cation transport ATPase
MIPPTPKSRRSFKERQALLVGAVLVAFTVLLPLWTLLMAAVFAAKGMWWPCTVMVGLSVLFGLLTRFAFKAYRQLKTRGFGFPPN